jgi:TonB family protein
VGNWPVYANGQYFTATGQMRIKSFDGRQHLTIQRTDESGFLGGMSILYEGDWDGTRIQNGKGVYFFNGAHGVIKWSVAKVPTISPEDAAKLFISGSTSAVYPGMARLSHANGEAQVEFTIRPDGTVTDVTALPGHGSFATDFADSATQAILQSKFRPYIAEGQPTAVRTSVTYKFALGAGVQRVPKY